MLQIFSAFNLVALAVISALFLWVMALAVAGTAHEGVPFGKRFSSLWMPLRFVGAMGALAPIFKGLSLFQVAILACIGFSINLGNFVWELGTDYFVEHAGQITVQAPDQNVTHYAAITNGALESLTLQYYLNERRGMNIPPGGEWNYKSNWFRSGGEYQFLFNGNAGSIQVSCVDESDALCRGKVNAVGTAISALSSVAQQLADPETPSSSIAPARCTAPQSGQRDHSFRTAKLCRTGTASKQARRLPGKLRPVRLAHRRFFLLVHSMDQSGSPRGHVLRHHLQPAPIYRLRTVCLDARLTGL